MEVNQAAEIILRAVHDDMNGSIVFSQFLAHQTKGYDARTSVEIQGIYNKALLVLLDEGLCHRGISADIIELGQKGIDCKGNYRRHIKKRDTRNFLEKTRRILPIFSFVFVVLGFYITYIKKKSNNERKKATIEQHRRDSVQARQRTLHKK
jgi:hypothetical protein